jgi:hypothetical protein
MTAPALPKSDRIYEFLKNSGGYGLALVFAALFAWQQIQISDQNRARDATYALLLEKQAAQTLLLTEKLVQMNAKLEVVAATLERLAAEERITQSIVRGESKPR